MLMSAQVDTDVIPTPDVEIPLEVTLVPVIKDIQGMDSIAMVF